MIFFRIICFADLQSFIIKTIRIMEKKSPQKL